MATRQTAIQNLYESTYAQLWPKCCDRFVNFGLFDEKCKTLTEANYKYVDWIVEDLGITQDSKLLSVGSGRGAYELEIIKRTGCTIAGVDLTAKFVDEATLQAKDQGLGDKVTFLLGDYLNLPEEVKSQRFTHVLALSCLFYVHDRMDQFLREVNTCTEKTSVLVMQDFVRPDGVPGEDIEDVIRHFRSTSPVLSYTEYKEAIEGAGFDITMHRNETKMAMRACDWVMKVSESISEDRYIFIISLKDYNLYNYKYIISPQLMYIMV